MRKESFFIRHCKAILILLMVLILVCASALVYSSARQKRENEKKIAEDASGKEKDDGDGGIYGESGSRHYSNDFDSLVGDQRFGVDKDIFSVAMRWIECYEKGDEESLTSMLTDGVIFDYAAYMEALHSDMADVRVIVKDFVGYSNDTTCVCDVLGMKEGENGEPVYDLDGGFVLSFSILDDGSVMPYKSGMDTFSDPYIRYGISKEEDRRVLDDVVIGD